MKGILIKEHWSQAHVKGADSLLLLTTKTSEPDTQESKEKQQRGSGF